MSIMPYEERYKSNIDIFELKNSDERHNFYKKIHLDCKLNMIFNNFKDYNINNYLACYIYLNEFQAYIEVFDEKLYNKYHATYYKYYSKNNDTKLIVYTNNKLAYKWCRIYFKFFNVLYIYISSDNDVTTSFR
jgi:hypothetical protein